MEFDAINSEKKYCQRQAIIFNSFNQIITNTLTGDIMVLFLTDVLLFKTVNITFIISLIPLIALIRLPLIFVLRRCNKVKIIELSIYIKIAYVIILLTIPWNVLDMWKYTALIIIYQVAVEFGVGICWQPLMKEITSERDRGQFFSNMRFLFMTLNTIFVFLLSLVVGAEMNHTQYKALLLISLFGFFVQIYAIRKISRQQIISEYNGAIQKKTLLKLLTDNKNILWALILDFIFICIGFTLNVVYLKTVLGYSSKLVSLYITINNLGGTVSLPIIGRLLDRNLRKGSRYIIFLYLAYMIILIMLPAYLPGNIFNILFIIALALLSGMIASGVYLFMTMIQHSLVNIEDSFIVLNIYQIVIYVATFIITNIFGVVISRAVTDKAPINYWFSVDLFKAVNILIILISIGVINKMLSEKSYIFS